MHSQAFSRKQRVADQIGREIASLLLTELNDPRTHGLTVSGVDLSPDMRLAKIHVSVPGDRDHEEVIRVLQHAGGYLRRCLGQRVRLRYLPRLEFHYDETLDRSDRIEHLLRGATGPDRH